MRKVTFNIEDFLHQALCLKAADSKQSMSELVNDSLEVYFEEYLSNEIISDTSIHPKPVDPETKREILSRLLEESQSIVCRESNAADSQDFLYGEDGMPS